MHLSHGSISALCTRIISSACYIIRRWF